MLPRNSFGEFIDHGWAYRIITPLPPRELENCLYSDDGYYAKVRHWGSGSANVKFPDGEIYAIVSGDSKIIHCRDHDSGKVWCPGSYPTMSPVEDFVCEHRDASTEFASTVDGLRVSWRLVVPLAGARELWTVTVENRRGTPGGGAGGDAEHGRVQDPALLHRARAILALSLRRIPKVVAAEYVGDSAERR